MGKLISDQSEALFPISTIEKLVLFFEDEFLSVDPEGSEPNLALLSIILGIIEHSLVVSAAPANTGTSNVKKQRSSRLPKKLVQTSKVSNGTDSRKDDAQEANTTTGTAEDFPPLEYDVILGLYDKFKAILLSNVNSEVLVRDRTSSEGTSRELIKSISDIFWNTLSRSYLSEKPHLQTLYTYLTGSKLDSFGLAFAVVAGCQLLGLSDVHLVLSEDHAWISFGRGEQASSAAEVTWHGKGSEDKRGRPIEDSLSWLYLKGCSVVCNRWTEIAASVASINPSINGVSDSLEMGIIQQKLLWKLYQHNYLQQYPMGIDHLADLEEISPTDGVKPCVELYEEAISCCKGLYRNMHVYPYISYGGYLYRREDFKGALKCWSEAAQVISQYSKVDEEIYKEFMEISRELLTSMMKKCSTGFSANSPTRDPACYADLLRFFDGICLWEELGSTPVLHITWAQTWISAIGKFESTAREGVRLMDWVEPSQPSEEVPSSCDVERSTSAAGFTDMNGNSKGSALDEDGTRFVQVHFKSFKMKNVKALLQKEKFNPATLSLQLTAQPSLLIPEKVGTADGPRPRAFSVRIRGSKTKAKDENEESSASTSRRTKRIRQDSI